jgi:hypothetical protein
MKKNDFPTELTTILSYAGYVLVAHELVKSMIVRPIKSFYENTTFEDGPFHSYEKDVLTRNKNEFEACLSILKTLCKQLIARTSR